MPFGIGRFLSRNAGTIGTIAGYAVGGPIGGMIGGAAGSAFRGTRPQQGGGGGMAPMSSAPIYDTTAGTGLGSLLTQTVGLVNEQRNRNTLQEAYRGAQAGALGPAAYIQSAVQQGAGRAAARLGMEGAEREAQQISSRALQGQVGLEQQRAQTLLGLTGAQAGLVGQQIQAQQFGYQQRLAERQQQASEYQFGQQMAMAEREQSAANLDALLGLGATLLTSPTEGTALSNVMSRGRGRISNLFGRFRGGNQTSVTATMGMG